jgi:hypothetical protein
MKSRHHAYEMLKASAKEPKSHMYPTSVAERYSSQNVDPAIDWNPIDVISHEFGYTYTQHQVVSSRGIFLLAASYLRNWATSISIFFRCMTDPMRTRPARRSA